VFPGRFPARLGASRRGPSTERRARSWRRRSAHHRPRRRASPPGTSRRLRRGDGTVRTPPGLQFSAFDYQSAIERKHACGQSSTCSPRATITDTAPQRSPSASSARRCARRGTLTSSPGWWVRTAWQCPVGGSRRLPHSPQHVRSGALMQRRPRCGSRSDAWTIAAKINPTGSPRRRSSRRQSVPQTGINDRAGVKHDTDPRQRPMQVIAAWSRLIRDGQPSDAASSSTNRTAGAMLPSRMTSGVPPLAESVDATSGRSF
jgi:hypothetical protein